jgi:Mrp family chromosome partitioning ATPase
MSDAGEGDRDAAAAALQDADHQQIDSAVPDQLSSGPSGTPDGLSDYPALGHAGHLEPAASAQPPAIVDDGVRELASDELRATTLIGEGEIPSPRGWRNWLRVATFGAITLGQSRDERRVRDLKAVVDSALRGTHSVVVLGGKGGAGKTTISIGLGSMFALLHHKVVAIDGNPDIGANLGDRIDPSAGSSYQEVLADGSIDSYAALRSHVGKSPVSGLDVLAANRNVTDRKLLDAKTYLAAHERLRRFYSVLVTDSGTNV